MLDYRAEEQKEAPQGTSIHATAIVYKGAELDVGVTIGPRAVIGPKVKLGRNVKVGAGAVVEGKTTVGEATEIYPMASIGSDPQDLKYRGEDTELIIGRNNRLREYVNISTGTATGS